MFAHRFFPSRMFTDGYFPPADITDLPVSEPPTAGGGGLARHFWAPQPPVFGNDDDDAAIGLALALL